MCGIVGFAGEPSLKARKVFKDLLRMDVIRGPHSTGVAFVSPSNKVDVIKKALLPDDLFSYKPFDDRFKSSSNCFIGHNRYATQGAINGVNAHPFEFPNVVGVHNGTLRKQSRLPDHKDFEVDSENIFYSINEDGIDTTVGKLEGAYTLAYYDRTDSTLKLVRNKERPMFYCFNEERTQFFYASENWMLVAALGRNQVKHTPVEELPVDTLMTVSFPLKHFYTAKIDEVTVRMRAVVPFTPPPLTIYQGKKHGGTGGKGKGKGVSAGNLAVTPNFDSKLIGSKHSYVPVELLKDAGGREYIHCVLLDDPSKEVRLYVPVGRPNVAAFARYKDRYLTSRISSGSSIDNGARVYYIAVADNLIVTVMNEGDKQTLAGKLRNLKEKKKTKNTV